MMAQRGMVARGPVRAVGVGRCGGPVGADGREAVSVRRLLEWAFASEAAQLDYDEVGAVAGGQRPGIGMEARIAEQLALGKRQGCGVRVDTSVGRTLPPADADMVATVVRNTLSWSVAVMMAEYARACRVPVWDLGPQRMVPRAWGRANQHGQQGQTEVCGVCRYVSQRRGRIEVAVSWVPVTLAPSSAQIAAARRGYLDWWGGLLSLREGLCGVDLDWFRVSDGMPVRTPWQNGG